jgi:hypothetical protein
MDGTGYELAELNMGRMLAPLDSETMRGFVEGLDPINALADDAPGFVWRLQTEDGDATAVRAWDDVMLILNLSVSCESWYATHPPSRPLMVIGWPRPR